MTPESSRSTVLVAAVACLIVAGSACVLAADATLPDAPANPKLVKLPFSFPTGMENTPVVFGGRPLLVDNHRPGGFEAKGENAYLFITDLTTGQEVARFGKGHSFVSAFVERRRVERLCHGVHRFRQRDQHEVHQPFQHDRLEDVEAGVGHPARRRRAVLQHLGLPRRSGLRHGLRVERAGEVVFPIRPVQGPVALGEDRRTGIRRRRGQDGGRQSDDSLLRAVLLRDLRDSLPSERPLGTLSSICCRRPSTSPSWRDRRTWSRGI